MSDSTGNGPTLHPSASGASRGNDGQHTKAFAVSDEDKNEAVAYLQHFLRVLRAQKWLLLAVAATVLALAVIQVFTTTPLYRATAILQIDSNNAKVLPYEEVADSTTRSSPFSTREDIQTQSRKLRTRVLAERVVRRLNLDTDPIFNAPVKRGFLRDLASWVLRAPRSLLAGSEAKAPTATDLEPVIGAFLGGLQIQPVRSTRLIGVSFTSHDAQLAALIVNTLAEEFIEQHLETKFRATERAGEFLRKQLRELQSEVEKSEVQLLDYARNKNIVNLGERETISRNKLADLSDHTTKAQSELIAQQARYEATLDSTLESFSGILKNDVIIGLEEQLSDLEREQVSQAASLRPDHPQVREVALKIRKISQQLDKEKRESMQTAREEYQLARSHYGKIASAVDDQRGIVDKLNEDSIQYNILKREVETNKELYEGLLQRLKEAGVSAGLRSSNIFLADAAFPPRGAISPRKTRSFLLALIVGLSLGVGAALAADALDNTVKGTEDITEQTGLPVLGFVPQLKLVTANQPKTGSDDRGESERMPVIAYSSSRQFQARDWEAYRSLRTSILLSHSGKPPQTILVTSSLPNEGKSTTATNTAIALAQTGARTLLIDLDLRKPSLSKLFGFDAPQGMSTFLSGNSELLSLIHETGFKDLHLMPSGPAAPNPSELVGSERMVAGLQLLKEHYQFIVIDSPPSLEFTDAQILSPHVEGVILIARSGRTPKDAIRKLSERFVSVGAMILGVLVNDLDFKGSDYGKYYGYYGEYYGTETPKVAESKHG